MTHSNERYGQAGAGKDAARFVALLDGQKGTLLKVAAFYGRTPDDRHDLIHSRPMLNCGERGHLESTAQP